MASSYPQQMSSAEKGWPALEAAEPQSLGNHSGNHSRHHSRNHSVNHSRNHNHQQTIRRHSQASTFNNKQRTVSDVVNPLKVSSPCPPVRSPDHYRAVFMSHITDSRLVDDRSDDERSSTTSVQGVVTSSHYLQLDSVQQVAISKRRKFSHPVSLQSSSHHHQRHPRRFSSAVSDAVTRKLSTTIGGWTRPSPVAIGDLVDQGKTLCGQYIRWRLKRCGMLPRKCGGLQRLRSCASLPLVREVLPELIRLGQELERMHPKVYTGVARQACPTPGGMITSEKIVTFTLTRVAEEIMRQGVSWPKIVALYAVAGGLAVDCVAQGHPQFVQSITEAMALALQQGVAPWIFLKGGWSGLHNYCKPATGGVSVGGLVGLLGTVLVAVVMLALVLRWLARTSVST